MRTVLVGAVAERLRTVPDEVAPRLDRIILDVAIRPDHIHLFIRAPPRLAPDQIMVRVKGYTPSSFDEALVGHRGPGS